MYKIILTKQAVKDALLIERAGLKSKAGKLLQVLYKNPYQHPPEYEKLQGLKNVYSRRINRQHRIVYEILSNTEGIKKEDGEPYTGIAKIIRMWTHYE
jgi:Txe/YoeB family toxin of toxin-antitoxin system